MLLTRYAVALWQLSGCPVAFAEMPLPACLCRGLFATHFHRLADVHADDPAVSIRHMACAVRDAPSRQPDQVSFQSLMYCLCTSSPNYTRWTTADCLDLHLTACHSKLAAAAIAHRSPTLVNNAGARHMFLVQADRGSLPQKLWHKRGPLSRAAGCHCTTRSCILSKP